MRRHPRRVAPLARIVASFATALIVVLLGDIALRHAVRHLSSARATPPAAEVKIATWLLHHSVPPEQRDRRNPVSGDADAIAAGRTLFGQKCEICHAYDGGGQTAIGTFVYPRAPALRGLTVQALSDGEIFYHIRNGIRNTAMPAWDFPDEQVWQIVAYLRHLPEAAPPVAAGAAAPTPIAAGARYVGSAACQDCHKAIYARWQTTRMANVVRDPKEHPDAIIPDMSQPDPLVTFTKDDIAFVYGSKWKQRYFKKVGDDYFVLPAQWDVTHKMWRKFFVPNTADWWTAFYPPDNLARPTGPLCDGCHAVNYDVVTKSVTEWNVGCERCHGPGSAHVARPVAETIVNPARLGYVAANDTCIQCHSQGRPPKLPIEGKYYDWPVGYHVGLPLDDFWNLEEHKLGETTFTHFADGTAHKNRMQGNDYVQSLMYARGVTCFSCHDPHGSENDAMLRRPASAVCSDCHAPGGQNGPRAATLAEHTHHKQDSPGSACVACHMPAIAQTIADVNVRSHNFYFVPPTATDALQIPNACNICHADKTTAWASEALKSWPDRSPWRVAP